MRERNRRAREYSRRCWARRWNRRLWILNILLGLAIAGILLWALTLPEAKEPEDAPPPLSAAVQSAVLSAAKPPEKAISYAERVKNNEFKEYKGRVMRKAYKRIQQGAKGGRK